MANPTTNFGWQMPTSSDLVTDLPADFEVFGQAVDTALVDLKGGTTGQILAKASNTNMDFTWVTNDVGDITAVSAGTGLTGGGTTGAVSLAIDTAVTADLTTAQTLTNKTLTSPALTTPTISTLTTNGDTLYGTGSGAIARLGVGTTGQVLTVSGGVPSWATPASGVTFAGCSLYSNNPTISTSTNTLLSWTAENYDTDGYHSTVTNTSRITIPTGKGGKYLFTYGGMWEGSNANFQNRVLFYKNGAQVKHTQYKYLQDNDVTVPVSIVLDLIATDYVEIYVWQNFGSNRVLYNDNTYGWFQASYLGA